MKNLLKLTSILLFGIFMVACSNDDDAGDVDDNQTIAEFVADNPNYSSLAAALERAGLTATLNGSASYTVFAPNNAAFDAFLQANNFASLEDVPEEALRQTLLNHVLNGELASGDLSTGYNTTLATYSNTDNNLSIYINTSNGVELNGVSTVTNADISAENGIIHAVDAVITLPTVVTFATADPTFETLVQALTRDDQPDFVGVLSTPIPADLPPFTVFGPTNDAFGALLTELSINSLADIDGGTLTATLNTHVIQGANVRAEDLTTGTVLTLGANIEVDADAATITDPNGRTSNIIVTNVQAANGVVHAIDQVLLPSL
ncbi:fasciclin domain-containing protein [Luteirhabdus pelagi]|uniref:fasciclin domain-containing protein n=1 Tax=Luteirhabdus pelagi TaxID=2792783 RepID=UPI0019394AC9|nr:fasciclin domain-containing protein [Luteirhabdus pelagi]